MSNSCFLCIFVSDYATIGGKNASSHIGGLYRSATSCWPQWCFAPNDNERKDLQFHPVGTSGRGQDNTGHHYCRYAGCAFLYPVGRDERSEGCA